MDKQTIGILGGNGFLGSNLAEYFAAQGHDVAPITKENYVQHKGKQFDLFINANGNSKKFWANQNPEADYAASVESVANSIKDFGYGTYVFISSSDVYPDHHDPALSREDSPLDQSRLETYGLHKLQAEELVRALPRYLVLRCGAMIGPGLKKGVVRDIADGTELFISRGSRLQFVTTGAIAGAIESLVEHGTLNDTLNCAGRGSVTVGDILKIFGKDIQSRAGAQTQQYEMDVEKLSNITALKTSAEYLQEFYEKQR